MNEFIIATHNTLAEGFYNSLKFFDNDIPNVHYLNAYVGDNTNFESDFINLVKKFKNESIVVFTDIPGGSVTQIVLKNIEKYDIKLITGINLSLVLELVLQTQVLTDDLIRQVINKSREQMVYMNDVMKEELDKNGEEDDLID